LTDDAEAVNQKVRTMFTDPNRVRADIPGKVEGNPVFIYHDAFNPDKEQVADFKRRYRQGKVGDVEVKRSLAQAINNFLEPIRQRRTHYEGQTGLVEDILITGTARVRAEARNTFEEVKDVMGMYKLPA
jgi:tryptophanyl-tRNA synthetase